MLSNTPPCVRSLYDVNNDGFITEDEMRLVVGAIYRLIDSAQADRVSPEERGQDLFTVSRGERTGPVHGEPRREDRTCSR